MSGGGGTDHLRVDHGAGARGLLLGERYELTERAGAGGAAEVWRAVDRRLGRDVAVKLLSGPAARDPVQRRRIEREAKALAALTHRNIVRIFDYAEEPRPGAAPIPYIVMEFVDGPDLARHLAHAGRLDVTEAVDLLCQVLDGIAQAHAIGIVHGDLKPGNILLAPEGQTWEAKVGDFGVARVQAEETGTTAPVATPAYAPPEVLRGERPTRESDVYSAACIAFEALTGERPFKGGTVWEATRQHMEVAPPSLRALRADVPEALEGVVQRALGKKPVERYPTAVAFAAALAAAIDKPVDLGSTAAIDAAETAGAAGEAAAQETATVPLPMEPTQAIPPPPARRWRRIRRLAAVPGGPLVAVAAIVVLLALSARSNATVRVPDLIGKQAGAAARSAEEAGFRIAAVTVSVHGAPGTVVGQDPAPGALRARGSEITVRVTRGLPQVTVPDVTGKPYADAVAILQQQGLSASSGQATFVAGTDVPQGAVAQTDPPAGTSVDRGSEVTLLLSLGGLASTPARGPRHPHGKGKGAG